MTAPTNRNENKGAPNAVCPTCAKSAVADYAPFCSKRCADVDLHRWLTGAYAIPAVEDDASSQDGGEIGETGLGDGDD